MDFMGMLDRSRPRYFTTHHTYLGMGLLIDLGYPYDLAKSVIFQMITGFGIGGLFQAPLIALQAAMPTRDMAVATGSMVLFRLLGSATGIAIGGTILNNQLAIRLAVVPGYHTSNIEGNVQGLANLDPAIQPLVLTAYAKYNPSEDVDL
jgi:hypothetical protein